MFLILVNLYHVDVNKVIIITQVTADSKHTLQQFLSVCPKRVCISTVGVRKDLYRRDPNKVPFFFIYIYKTIFLLLLLKKYVCIFIFFLSQYKEGPLQEGPK